MSDTTTSGIISQAAARLKQQAIEALIKAINSEGTRPDDRRIMYDTVRKLTNG